MVLAQAGDTDEQANEIRDAILDGDVAAMLELAASPERRTMSPQTLTLLGDALYNEGRIEEGDNLLLVSFGAGLTWGASVLTWGGA